MNEEHTDETYLHVKNVIKNAAQLGKTTYTTGLIVKQAGIKVNPVSESREHSGPSFKRRVVDKEDIKCDQCDYKYKTLSHLKKHKRELL